MTLVILNIVVHILAHMTDNPEIKFCRDLGLTTYVGLAIGAVGVVHVWRLTRGDSVELKAANSMAA